MKLKELHESTNEYAVLVDAIKKYCENNFSLISSGKVTPLYRGTAQKNYHSAGSGYRFLVSSARTEPRKSAMDNNIFLSFVSNHESWKDIPSREYSSFATPDVQRAVGFSPAWLIIPYDSVDRFAVMHDDFNYSVPDSSYIPDIQQSVLHLFDEMPRANYDEDFKKIISQKELHFERDHQYTIAEIKKLSDLIEHLIDYFKEHDVLNDEQDNLKYSLEEVEHEFGKNIWRWMEQNLTPVELGVRALPFDRINKIPSGAEVWFNGPYIAIQAVSAADTENILFSDWFFELALDVAE
jgi:hypothetical protein